MFRDESKVTLGPTRSVFIQFSASTILGERNAYHPASLLVNFLWIALQHPRKSVIHVQSA